MALIYCEECGRQVSDKAASCPECGAPIYSNFTREGDQRSSAQRNVEYKTLHFSNDIAGQKEKNKTLNSLAKSGWRVTSETITEGGFNGEKACCLGVMFPPLALCAGNKTGTINVTLERAT
jgi:predicted ATP-dependent serine protease